MRLNRKFKILVMILSVISIGSLFTSELKGKIKKLAIFNSNAITSETVEFLAQQVISQSLQINQQKEIITKILDNEIYDKENLKEEICKTDTEFSFDKLNVAKSYECLYKINNNKNQNIEALINIGRSVILDRTDSRMALLYDLIDPMGIELRQGFDPKSEMLFLNKAVESQNKYIAGMAALRLSYIYSIGRFDNVLNTELDLKKSVYYRKLAINNLQIQQKHIADLVALFDENYVPYALVTMLSALINSSPETLLNFSIIYDEFRPIEDSSIKLIQKFAEEYGFKVRFIKYGQEIIDKYKNYFSVSTKTYPRLTAVKALIYDILKDQNKVLVIDTDILVLDDLYNLFSKDQNGHQISASLGVMREGVIGRSEVCPELAPLYINSGILLFDLNLMRQDNFGEKVIELSKNSKCNFFFNDQDTLSIIGKSKINYFSKKYNMVVLSEDLNKTYPNAFMPFVIHYAGVKPWKYTEQRKGPIPEVVMAYYPYLDYIKEYMAKSL